MKIEREDMWYDGSAGTQLKSCPFWRVSRECGIRAKECNYGLTDEEPPIYCPLRYGLVVTVLRLGRHE